MLLFCPCNSCRADKALLLQASMAALPRPLVFPSAETPTSLSEFKQNHAQLLKTGLFRTNTFDTNKLISFAAADPRPDILSYALSVFSRISCPNSYSFNSIIRAYANSQNPEVAFSVFHQMLHGPVAPDKYTFTFLLKACPRFGGLQEGRQVHGLALKLGIGADVFVANTLIHLYATSLCLGEARNLLDKMPQRDVVSWNALLSGFIEVGFVELARRLFDEMKERNVESWNFMISGCLKVGQLEEAKRIFDRMPEKNVVSWNAMITGYAHASCFSEVLALFEEMQNAEVKPDGFTLVNVLSACAHLGALGQGEWICTYIDKNSILVEGFLSTAIVDMYSKCGSIDKALKVFRDTRRKDISTWNSIITGLGIHGRGKQALKLFSEMLMEGFEPNEVTFIGVLSACSRAGLLDEGQHMFDLMVEHFTIQPSIKHYGCLVDLLGRQGLLDEALALLRNVPRKEASVLWESILGACKIHGNAEMAEYVARELLNLNPDDGSGFVQLSNTYATLERWEDVVEVRRKMKAQNVNKEPGCSMIEVNGVVHEFLAGEGLIFY